MKFFFAITLFVLLAANDGFTQSDPELTLPPPGVFNIIDSVDAISDSIAIVPTFNIPDSVYMKRLSALPFNFPMTYNPTVRRYIELYTVRIKSKLQVIIGLSDFYFPIFDEALKNNNLPNELKYISIIESALNPRAASRARAVGLWQFIKSTGKENGLTINNYVDQRRGPLESTQAATKYLKTLYGIYGDWALVLAAYNCGPGNVNKALRRAKGKRDFWEIYSYLPRETRGYIPEFIGAAYAFNYYKEHNINPVLSSLPLRTDTIHIDQKLHLGQVSGVLGIPIDVLRRINPQYLKDIIPASSKIQYSLTVPTEQKIKFAELKDSIYSYHTSLYNSAPKKNRHTRQVAVSAGGKVVHHVRSGENIWLIAGQYKVTVNNIKNWNNITGNKIKKGQNLVVYLPLNGSELAL
jgi:membrane-bound lytic murein transglycosylase D